MNLSYHSKDVAESYSQHNITWPASVAEFIIQYLKRNMYGDDVTDDNHKFDLMMDVGCGGGQSTTVFAPYFRSIVGLDSSEEQIKIAKNLRSLDNVTYKVEPAEKISGVNESVDLITVAGAAHYIDLDKFLNECKRLLKPRGCAALFGYGYSDYRLDQDFLIDPNNRQLESGFQHFEKNYMQPRYKFARDSNHPIWRYLDRYSPIYDRIKTFRKERFDHLKLDWCITMADYQKYQENIPVNILWKKSLSAKEKFPLHVAHEAMKNQWGISDMDEKDIHLKITLPIFIIMLCKEKA